MTLFVGSTTIMWILGFLVLATWLFIHFSGRGDIRLSKPYLRKVLRQVKPELANGEITVTKMPKPELAAPSIEKVYYHVNAKGNEAEFDMALQAYYPHAQFDDEAIEQEIKNVRPDKGGGAMPDNVHTAGMDFAQNSLAEQNKIEAKDKKIRSLITAHQTLMDVLKDLNDITDIYPNLLYYDRKKHFAFLEFMGTKSLKDIVLNTNWDKKKAYLLQVIENLAQLHGKGQQIERRFPLAPAPSKEAYMDMMEESLATLAEVNMIQPEEVTTLANIYEQAARYQSIEGERGLKLKSCSPYDFFVHKNQVRARDWAGLRRDLICLDLAELLRDPVNALSLEQEQELIKAYIDTRVAIDDDFDSSDFLNEDFHKEYHLVASGHSLNQAGFMLKYIYGVKQKRVKGEEIDIVLANWDDQGVTLLLEKTVSTLMQHEESSEFATRLSEAIQWKLLTS